MQQATSRKPAKRAAEHVAPGAGLPHALRIAAAADRTRVERFIYSAYEAAYGARVTAFMPTLAVVERGTQIVAACGLRHAAGAALFVETYLDRAVEDALSTAAGAGVVRAGIVEVGNLAVSRPGYARVLIRLLTEHLYADRAVWVVFTAVSALRNNFTALDMPLFELGAARPERLTARAREDWGRYYDTVPRVSAVRVADAAAAIGRRS